MRYGLDMLPFCDFSNIYTGSLGLQKHSFENPVAKEQPPCSTSDNSYFRHELFLSNCESATERHKPVMTQSLLTD